MSREVEAGWQYKYVSKEKHSSSECIAYSPVHEGVMLTRISGGRRLWGSHMGVQVSAESRRLGALLGTRNSHSEDIILLSTCKMSVFLEVVKTEVTGFSSMVHVS